tara:strand:+ start:1084 stop:1470 length:387 start_codon:yes stop_codon:yes gene_type:complete
MSVFILSGNNCYQAPLHISPSAVNTVSSWCETSLPTVKCLLHGRYNRIPLHTFQSQKRTQMYNITLTWVSNHETQMLELSSNGKIDIEALTPFVTGILQEKKIYIHQVYCALYTGTESIKGRFKVIEC